jgi:hypothetical protein
VSDTSGLDLISAQAYAQNGAPHESWTRLRAQPGLTYLEPEGFESFYAVTRHADICEISKQPDRFSSSPGIVSLSEEQVQIRRGDSAIGSMRTIIEMDPPDHRDFRKVASAYFTPRSVGRVDDIVAKTAKELVDGLEAKASGGVGECDFATDIATPYPLRILSTILGVPQEQEPHILSLTNQLFGDEDPDLQRKGEDRAKASMELGMELYAVFEKIIEDRRANPRDDLASLLANGKVNGELMGTMETFGYYLITFTAGHDTTKNSLTGGMQAFARNPEQWAKLCDDPSLVVPAVEEVVRWAAPVNHMKRTVVEDLEYRGQKLREGDRLVLFYGSANRDETVFDDPFDFRIDRDPNPHLGFGIGEHFCLGANLARRTQRELFGELARRIESVELAGEPEQIASSFVIGQKSLPIRYKLKPTA